MSLAIVGDSEAGLETKLEARHLDFFYSDFQALKDINLSIPENQITALIGPSGCGKSTLLRVFNRMYDLIPRARADGEVLLDDEDVLGPRVDVVSLRQRVGMVFQRPNPFPMTIYDNVAYGPRILGWKKNIDEIVEQSLRQAALWDEVKDRLKALRAGAERRPAAAAGHRPRAGGGARGDPDGRARVGARPGGHA